MSKFKAGDEVVYLESNPRYDPNNSLIGDVLEVDSSGQCKVSWRGGNEIWYTWEELEFSSRRDKGNTVKTYPNRTSIHLLDEVKDIQSQRALEYEREQGERSFSKVASVFNTYTGKDLIASDVALILEILKNVRFYSQKGIHRDSIIDKISYASLWGELILQERSDV